MLSDRWTNGNAEPIKIGESKFDDFKLFLSYFYGKRNIFTEANIFTMADLAEMYDVYELKIDCGKFISVIHLKDSNIDTFYAMSKIYHIEDIREGINKFFLYFVFF